MYDGHQDFFSVSFKVSFSLLREAVHEAGKKYSYLDNTPAMSTSNEPSQINLLSVAIIHYAITYIKMI